MLPSERTYDVIVVGAGVEGSAAAYNAAINGASTLLLEQFPLPHNRGSSHGQSRIIRKAYDYTYYANMMDESYKMWRDLEKKQQKKLIQITGLLNFGDADEKFLRNTRSSLEAIGAPYTNLSREDIRQKYPQYSLRPGIAGVYDPEAGVIFADRAVIALQEQFKKASGLLRDAEKVVAIEPGTPNVVRTTVGRYRGKSVIIAAGPWTNPVIKGLGFQLPLVKIDVFYWKEKKPLHSASQNFPVLVYTSDQDKIYIYGLPALEYPQLVKVCSHEGPAIDPDTRDVCGTTEEALVARFVRNNMPYLEDKPSIKETCIYTVTPDGDFIIDTVPEHKSIVIAAGFSGHGFKMAPVVGKILYELATQRKPSYDIHPFRIARFRSQSKL